MFWRFGPTRIVRIRYRPACPDFDPVGVSASANVVFCTGVSEDEMDRITVISGVERGTKGSAGIGSLCSRSGGIENCAGSGCPSELDPPLAAGAQVAGLFVRQPGEFCAGGDEGGRFGRLAA